MLVVSIELSPLSEKSTISLYVFNFEYSNVLLNFHLHMLLKISATTWVASLVSTTRHSASAVVAVHFFLAMDGVLTCT